MTTKDIYSQSEHHMKRSVETLKENLMKIRTGRAHTGLLEHITVDYYGCPTPISQVAQLGLADARTITVQPWEKKMVAVVEKAIRNSDLGLNPATSGEVIRVPMPPLTEERRRDLTKVVRSEGEETKVAIRNLRRLIGLNPMTSQELTAKPRERVPRHVAIVMDGNGRWAKARKLPRLMGHQKGVESVRTAIQTAAKAGVQHLTLFAFSSENWNRPAEEVKGLMKLFLVSLRREIAALNKANVRVRLVGDLTAFSEELQQQIADSMKITENNTGLTLNVCVNYGGRWEILEAAKRSREVPPEELTEQKFASLLPLADSGDVDLFIRTSGEERISNFMLWQLAYGELYFTKILWPDFTENEFLNALNWYSNRERRFGKTSEQIQQEAKKE